MEAQSEILVEKKEPKFSFSPILILIGAIFIESLVFSIVLLSLDPTQESNIYYTLSFMLGKIAALIYLVLVWRKRVKECSRDARADIKKFFLRVLIGLGIVIFIAFIVIIYEYVIGIADSESSNSVTLDDLFNGSSSIWNYLMLFSTVVLFAPFVEELEFRDLIFRSFKGAHWLVPLFVGSILFVLAHLGYLNIILEYKAGSITRADYLSQMLEETKFIPVYFLPGFALGLVYHYGKNNFWTDVAAHACWNLVAFVLYFI